MPAWFALTLCVLFVAFLLALERKHYGRMSIVLWIPTIWTFYCASRPMASWFLGDTTGAEKSSVEEGSAIDRAFLGVLILVGTVILIRRRPNWVQIFKDSRWIILLYGFMAISISWSDYPYVSFKRWFKAFGSLLMAWVVLAQPNPAQAIETILRRVGYVLLPFSLLLIKYYPLLGVEYSAWTGTKMWAGVSTQKNNLSIMCTVTVVFLIWTYYKKWRRGGFRIFTLQSLVDLGILLLALLLLKGPPGVYSATSIVTLFIALAALFGLIWMKGRRAGFKIVPVVLSFGIYIGMAIPLLGGGWLSGLLSLLGRDTTFTGRTDIWGELLPIAWQNPIFGRGYGSFWINPPITWPGLTHSHNGYLEVFLELGLVGLFLLFAFLFSFCRKAQQALVNDFEWAAFSVCIVFLVLFHDVSECSFARASTYLWSVLLYIAVLLPRLSRPRSKSASR